MNLRANQLSFSLNTNENALQPGREMTESQIRPDWGGSRGYSSVG